MTERSKSKFETGEWTYIGSVKYEQKPNELFVSGRNQVSATVKHDSGYVAINYSHVMERGNGDFYAGSNDVIIPLEIYDELVDRIAKAREVVSKCK